MFAARFRESVGGLVLVDSAHEEQVWRLAAIAPALVDAEYGGAWRDLRARKDLGFLGNGEILKWETKVPLIVLQQGRALPERPELGLTAKAIPQVTALWGSLQKDLASRSPSGELRTAQRSGHFIQKDEPEFVVRAVQDVLAKLAVPLVPTAEMYFGAQWEADAVVVTTREHRQIVVAKDKDQVGLDQVAVSPDHSAVGWLALYPNCCTSYPIPLKLIVFSDGQLRAFSPNELPIWYWSFRRGAREVCYEQETVHGGLAVQYELREVATGRLLARFEPGRGGSKPAWVEELEASRSRSGGQH
jgi:hypothetical protein